MNRLLLIRELNQYKQFEIRRSLVSFKNIFGGRGDKNKAIKNDNEFEDDIMNEPTNINDNKIVKTKPRNETVSRLVRKKAYKPELREDDIENEIKKICIDIYEFKNERDYNPFELEFNDSLKKFKILTKCINLFKHDILNTKLNDIKRPIDLIEYYKQEQKDTNPLEDLIRQDNLPLNLNINLEYNRFNSKQDTFFNGLDAYPNRSTYTASLWYSKKYKPINKKKDLLFTK